MTKKDYWNAVNTIKKMREEENLTDTEAIAVVSFCCRFFASDNPRFDHQRLLKAVTPEIRCEHQDLTFDICDYCGWDTQGEGRGHDGMANVGKTEEQVLHELITNKAGVWVEVQPGKEPKRGKPMTLAEVRKAAIAGDEVWVYYKEYDEEGRARMDEPSTIVREEGRPSYGLTGEYFRAAYGDFDVRTDQKDNEPFVDASSGTGIKRIYHIVR